MLFLFFRGDFEKVCVKGEKTFENAVAAEEQGGVRRGGGEAFIFSVRLSCCFLLLDK